LKDYFLSRLWTYFCTAARSCLLRRKQTVSQKEQLLSRYAIKHCGKWNRASG